MASKAKFEGVDFYALVPRSLDPAVEPDSTGFRPKRGEFATYWKRGRIRRECRANIGACWYLSAEGVLAAYITLLADRLEVEDPRLEGEGIAYRTFPAVKIGLLAADERARHAGTALLRWAFVHILQEIRPRLGVRFVTVDALFDPDGGYDVASFYEKHGFEMAVNTPPPQGQHFRTMFFDLALLDQAAGG